MSKKKKNTAEVAPASVKAQEVKTPPHPLSFPAHPPRANRYLFLFAASLFALWLAYLIFVASRG